MTTRVAVVGAGFSGAVIAHELATRGLAIDVFDSRTHIAGNCHTARDESTGVMTHIYGPHIFHTSQQRVWDYIRQFDEFLPFVNRVKAVYDGRIYSLPINLMTINSFFGKLLSPKEAESFIAALGESGNGEPQTFEEQALRFLGQDLYEAFFKGYTRKQWGVTPDRLPASILRRLPVRFSYDDNYYSDPWQGLPRHGYTHIVGKLLDHPSIRLQLGCTFESNLAADYEHVFYSGPIDAWFGNCQGPLAYRTLDFAIERHDGDYQGNPVINYCDLSVPWTRITEHKHFSPWETHARTIIYKEHSRACGVGDIPYYPIRLADDKAQLARYIALARQTTRVTFVGRLGTYRYLDMDLTISEALDTAARYLEMRSKGDTMPAFIKDPLA